VPLAVDGYWHPPQNRTVFYVCDAGLCNAEDHDPAFGVQSVSGPLRVNFSAYALPDNCRLGHTGPTCSLCLPGWTLAGDYCQACDPKSSFSSWNKGRLGVFLAFMFLLFVLVTVMVMLKPLVLLFMYRILSPAAIAKIKALAAKKEKPDADASKSEGDGSADAIPVKEAPKESSMNALVNVVLNVYLPKLMRLNKFAAVPQKMTVNELQIISSFKKTMLLAWPSVFSSIMSRLNILNFHFLALPQSACQTPTKPVFQQFMGITLSVFLILVYMGLLWASGVGVMWRLKWPSKDIDSFNRGTLSKVLLVLSLTYAPITEVTLAIFNCRDIAGTPYLRADMAYVCYTGQHMQYYRAAIWWTIFFVVGVPVTNLLVLLYYNVPQVAHELKHNAQLRALIDLAYRKKVPQPLPMDGAHGVTVHTITAEHVDALYAAFYPSDTGLDPERVARISTSRLSPVLGSIRLHYVQKLQPEAAPATKLQRLLMYSAEHLQQGPVTWHDAAHDPRMDGALETVGSLLSNYYADAWYWELVETLKKLLLTGVLSYIAPGRIGQVVAGFFLTFAFMLAILLVQPFSDQTYRRVAEWQAVTLFLFFVFALLVKAGVDTMSTDGLFKNSCFGILMCSVFSVPVIAVGVRLRWTLSDKEVQDETGLADVEEEEDVFQALERKTTALAPAAPEAGTPSASTREELLSAQAV